MKFEFTDNVTGDTWIEIYRSRDEITDEILEGVTVKAVFECQECSKEFTLEDCNEDGEKICPKCKQ